MNAVRGYGVWLGTFFDFSGLTSAFQEKNLTSARMRVTLLTSALCRLMVLHINFLLRNFS